MQSSKILLKDGQTVDLVDNRIDDGDIETWNNKLNVEITSPNGTINVQSSTDVQTKTKTFDISVNTDIVATNKDVSDLEDKINHKLDSKEDVSNKIQVVHDSSTVEYPSSKAVADFVNSSVATNTATFLGNFSLDDLGLTYPATEVQIATALNSHTWPSGYPTNKDYVYVEIRNPQSSIYDKVQRYKYRAGVASWGYEYTLNNSSFTAEEMAAIDSGVTSHDVTNLRADHTTLGTHVDNTSNPHKVTKSQVGLGNVDNTRDADKPVSTAQQNALNKKLDKTGDASNTTASFTKNSGDTSSVTSGSKLSTIFTAISSFFASLKALAFKDKVSDSDINGTISDSHIANASSWNGKYTKPSTGIPKGDLDSAVQNSLDKADTALQSHQDISGKADKSNITGATKCKITYNSQGIVTAGNDLSASDIPNLAASKITSGTFGTDRIADDAITAAKVKDNETLPVNITGLASKSVDYEYVSDTNVIARDSTADSCKTYFANNVSKGRCKVVYCKNGSEYTLIFSKQDSGTHGSIIKYGYSKNTIYMLRYSDSKWESTDWEVISAGSVAATVGNSITSTGTNGSMEILNGALSSSGGDGGSCSIDGDGISFTKGVGGSSMTADGISTVGTGTFTAGAEAKGRSIDGSATFVNRASIYWSPSTTNLVVNRAAGSRTIIDLKDLRSGVVYWLHVPRDNTIAMKNSSAISTFYCYDSSFTVNNTNDTCDIRSHIKGGSHGGFSSAIVRSNNNFYVMMDY